MNSSNESSPSQNWPWSALPDSQARAVRRAAVGKEPAELPDREGQEEMLRVASLEVQRRAAEIEAETLDP